MTMRTLRDLLADGRVHVLDGAMGTMLYGRGVFLNVCYDELNLKQPELVREMHEAYVRAGAEILETNTFGANPVKLSAYGLAERHRGDQPRRGGARARAAARTGPRVLGAIGPLGVRIEPFGDDRPRTRRVGHFTRQARGLLEGGVDGFILETFSDSTSCTPRIRAVRARHRPARHRADDGRRGRQHLLRHRPVETFGRELDAMGADVDRLNCSVGPGAACSRRSSSMAEVTSRPLSAQPNAGLPRAVGDRKIYLASPSTWRSYARRLIEAGARFVGGCCGTTPEHIRRIRGVRRGHSAAARVSVGQPTGARASGGRVSSRCRWPSAPRWGRKLAEGDVRHERRDRAAPRVEPVARCSSSAGRSRQPESTP